MKKAILLPFVFCAFNLFALDSDSLRKAELAQKIKAFEPILKENLELIRQSDDLQFIQQIAVRLEEYTDELIGESVKVYNINSDYLTNYHTTLALGQAIPLLSAHYTSEANRIFSEGISQPTPDNYSELKNISHLSHRLSHAKTMAKVQKISNKMQANYEWMLE